MKKKRLQQKKAEYMKNNTHFVNETYRFSCP